MQKVIETESLKAWRAKEAKLDNALAALSRIRDARDYSAEHGEYPPDFGVDGYACFDDWAADIASTVLNQ